VALNKKDGQWGSIKEKILFFLGVGMVIFEVVNSEILQKPFHYPFLLAALALCGVAITQWVDRG